MAPPSRITLWGCVAKVAGSLCVATALVVGIPLAAVRFDDPGRLAWLLTVPLLVAFAGWVMVREPYRIVISDLGIEVKSVGRSRWFDRHDLKEIDSTRRTMFMGEGVALWLKSGRRVELPNDQDQVYSALHARYPEVAWNRSDSRYL